MLQSQGSLLEQYIVQVREALGVEIQPSVPLNNHNSGLETESDTGDIWHQHLDELSDKLNHVCVIIIIVILGMP